MGSNVSTVAEVRGGGEIVPGISSHTLGPAQEVESYSQTGKYPESKRALLLENVKSAHHLTCIYGIIIHFKWDFFHKSFTFEIGAE